MYPHFAGILNILCIKTKQEAVDLVVVEEVLLEDHQDHRLVDDEAEALAEAQVEDQHDEAVEVADFQVSTSISRNLSTRQS
jgi:hypothetical protein